MADTARGVTPARAAASGTLVGLAVGDAVGAPVEFEPSLAAMTHRFGPFRSWEPPRPIALVTDDTQLTLAVARALALLADCRPRTVAAALVAEFVRWSEGPVHDRAPGAACLAACAKLRAGSSWLDATQRGAKGCGANMRVAPVGLVPGVDDSERTAIAHLVAAVTHGHPTALAASDLTARTVHLLRGGLPAENLLDALRRHASTVRYDEEWLGALWRRPGVTSPEDFVAQGYAECLAALDRVQPDVPVPDGADPCAIAGGGWVAEEALAAALQCFLPYADDPVLAVRRAAATGGDSDSIACLTGAFAGARHGLAAWPADWVERLEHRDELLALGARWD